MLNDADLHGLVDGHLDPDRRADVLRRAAASPRDRALIEDWQDQTDLIRAAFVGVEREPLPQALDLRTGSRLRTIAGPTREAGAARDRPRRLFSTAPSWRGTATIVATLAAMAAGLAGSWYVARLPARADRPAPSRVALDDERMIADRTVAALAFADPDAGTERPAPAAPPVATTIPDLSDAGLTFVDAQAGRPSRRSLVLRYRDAAGAWVAIGMLRTAADDAALVPRDSGYTWRKEHLAVAVFGTVGSDRLLAVAVSLRADGPAK